jgi:hypothetical protein
MFLTLAADVATEWINTTHERASRVHTATLRAEKNAGVVRLVYECCIRSDVLMDEVSRRQIKELRQL